MDSTFLFPLLVASFYILRRVLGIDLVLSSRCGAIGGAD